MRQRIYEIVEPAEDGDRASFIYDVFVAAVAFVSVIKLLVGVGGLPDILVEFVVGVDAVAVTILFFDYILRWVTYDLHCEERGKKRKDGSPLGWTAFAIYPFTPLALIDLISLLPSLIVMPAVCKYLIILRLFKVFRMLRGLFIIRNVFIREGRTLLSILFITLLYVLCVALIMYTYEPDIFIDFIDAFYWSTTALATIGYGDISPQTQLGKVINIISALVGIAVIALPSGIITGGYVAEVRRQNEKGLRSKRAIKAKRALDELIEDRAAKAGKAFKKKRILRYFKRNPRVVRYAVVIIICEIINCTLYMLSTSGSYYFPFDCWGTALAAFLIEPVAGILVGYIGNFLYAFVTGNLGDLLYLMCDLVIAVGFGSLISLKRGDGKPRPRRDIVVVVVMALAVAALDIFIGAINGDFGQSIASIRESIAFDIPEDAVSAAAALLLFVISLVNFTLCYFVLLLIRPIKRYLDKREARDRDREAQAHSLNEKQQDGKEGDTPMAAEGVAGNPEDASGPLGTKADSVPAAAGVSAEEGHAERSEPAEGLGSEHAGDGMPAECSEPSQSGAGSSAG